MQPLKIAKWHKLDRLTAAMQRTFIITGEVPFPKYAVYQLVSLTSHFVCNSHSEMIGKMEKEKWANIAHAYA